MMKKLLLCLVLGIAAVCSAEDSAFRKGAAYLLARQGQDGSWGRHPAITGLVCMALNGTHKDAVEKGRAYLLKHVRSGLRGVAGSIRLIRRQSCWLRWQR